MAEKIVLASASARRREILSSYGIEFEVEVSGADENMPASTPAGELVATLAQRKAQSVAAAHPNALVIGSDTVVEYNGEIFGKPRDREDAYRILSTLSGKRHNVYSGIAAVCGGRVCARTVCTEVEFFPLESEKIYSYIDNYKPYDKAGAYAIQEREAGLVKCCYGDYDNVVGLPAGELFSMVKSELGVDMLSFVRPSLRPSVRGSAKRKAYAIAARLSTLYPEAECALEYSGSPWKLVVMARLSAQCTDKRVNEVCRGLFETYPSAAALAAAEPSSVEQIIKPCGLFRTKAKDIIAECALLAEREGEMPPNDMESLLAYPGIGRKIANLILGDIYKQPAIVADTHCIRLASRLGLTACGERDPLRTEKRLKELIAPEWQNDFCHRLVMHGRAICRARDPQCSLCALSDICKKAGVEK